MNMIQRIKAKTPKTHKILGRIATVLSGLATTLLFGGYVDEYPKVKILCVIVAFLFGGQALFHAQKIEK